MRTAAAVSEQLYARHSRMVTGLCRALLRDRIEAEDAAQQTFLSAHRALLNGVAPRESAAWLATIARNECWARITSRMREPLPTDAADEVTSVSDPVAEAIRRADLAALWTAIRALPKPQREALLLREFGGLRYDELAAAIGVSESAVESLLFRARTRLRTAYAAVVGGAWLEPLARLLAGGGAPALATKAVAIGLGTAAVTGTAVVVPNVVDRHHRRPAPAPLIAAVTPAAVVAPTAAQPTPATQEAPRMFVPHQSRHSEPARLQESHDAEHETEHQRRGGGGDDHGSSTTSSDGSEGRSGPPSPVVEAPAVTLGVEEPSVEEPADDAGGGHDGGAGNSGPGSSGSGSGESGRDGGSDDGA